jgi:hypothetical protein
LNPGKLGAEVYVIFDRYDTTDVRVCTTLSAAENETLDLLQRGANYDDIAIVKGQYLEFVPKIVE